MHDNTDRQTDGLLDPLTGRELEILRLLADGLTDQQIGEHLYLSTGTIKWHLKNIYSKLGTHKRTAAIAHARRIGLLAGTEPLPLPANARLLNLPVYTEPVVGRESELASLHTHILDPAHRLITLVGVGGTGKTRLAVEAAWHNESVFQDGVAFVSLDYVPSPEFLPLAIADALHIPQHHRSNLPVQLQQMLSSRHLLLILDGFEHLISEAPYVMRIIAAAPKLKVLITSRENLNVRSEWVFNVPGLSVPQKDDADALLHSGAAQFFILRAKHITDKFSETDHDAVIRHLCRFVDGSPLGIELLTSWLTILTPEEILRAVQQSDHLLQANWRDQPDRHRSIRAVFEASWWLLTSDEQDAFTRIAVFQNGFSRAAAERVAGAALTVLASLIRKSLIHVRQDGRYEIHALLHQYAEMQLRQNDDLTAAVQQRHSAYYAEALSGMFSDESGTGMLADAIRQDGENILTGARYSVQRADLALIRFYAEGLWQHFQEHGWYLTESIFVEFYLESIGLFEASLYQSPSEETERTLSLLYEGLGKIRYGTRLYHDAKEAYRNALKHAEDADRLTRSRLYRAIGNMDAALRIPSDEAFAAYKAAETALGIPADEHDITWWQAWIQIHLDQAWLHYLRSDIAAITDSLDQVAAPAERYGTLMQRGKLAYVAALRDFRQYGFYDLPNETLLLSRRAVEMVLASPDHPELAWYQFSLGFTHLWRGEFEQAETQIRSAIERAQQWGDSMGTLEAALAYLPVVYRRNGQVDKVERWALFGRDIAEIADTPVYVAASTAHLGWVCYRRGQMAQAQTYCEQALANWAVQTIPYPFQWMAFCPLLGQAVASDQSEDAIRLAQKLLTPPQQRLSGGLSEQLQQAVTAWENGQAEAAHQQLIAWCVQASALGYT